MRQQDQKSLAAKIENKTQSEMTVKLSDPKMMGAFLNSVNPSFKSEKGERVTAVRAKAMYHTATENQTQQRLKHSDRSCPSNTVIKVLLDSGSVI